MYEIVYFDLALRREDDFSPLIGIRFFPNQKNKLFSLLVQEYDIIWSDRYQCYTLPDDVLFNHNELIKYTQLIEITLEKIKSNNIDEELIIRERSQSYYTKPCLVRLLTGYINNTCDENSILLDPVAGIGNLTDDIRIPKENIFLVEPDEKKIIILKEKGYKNIINSTFEEYLSQGNIPIFSHVIMNPPFKNRLDLFFFNRCFELLREHGRIAAIISENSIYEELGPLGLTFNIDFPSSKETNNFDGITDLLQEYVDNLHNTKNCLMDTTTSFCNTKARAYSLLAEKESHNQQK